MGLLDGLAEWNDSDGVTYFRTYEKGLENGPAKDMYPDKTIDEFNYVYGRVVGKLITTKNNILISVCDYDNYVRTNCDNKK